MPDMKLMIRCENQTVKVTDGLLTIPIHVIHAYSNGVMFCSISDPEKLNNVLIDVPSMRYLSTDPDQPVYIQEKDGQHILHMDLTACTFR